MHIHIFTNKKIHDTETFYMNDYDICMQLTRPLLRRIMLKIAHKLGYACTRNAEGKQ